MGHSGNSKRRYPDAGHAVDDAGSPHATTGIDGRHRQNPNNVWLRNPRSTAGGDGQRQQIGCVGRVVALIAHLG